MSLRWQFLNSVIDFNIINSGTSCEDFALYGLKWLNCHGTLNCSFMHFLRKPIQILLPVIISRILWDEVTRNEDCFCFSFFHLKCSFLGEFMVAMKLMGFFCKKRSLSLIVTEDYCKAQMLYFPLILIIILNHVLRGDHHFVVSDADLEKSSWGNIS